LGPYELRSFVLDSTVEPIEAVSTPPADIREAIEKETADAFGVFSKVRANGRYIPGMDELESRMKSALEDGRLAWLRRALTGYIVRKCKQM